MIAKGIDIPLFSNTMDTSLRDPDFVNCFALSMTRRNVSCWKLMPNEHQQIREMKYIYFEVWLAIWLIVKIYDFLIIQRSKRSQFLCKFWYEQSRWEAESTYWVACSENAINWLPSIPRSIEWEVCYTSRYSRNNLRKKLASVTKCKNA